MSCVLIFQAEFFGHAQDSAKALAPVLEKLKDM